MIQNDGAKNNQKKAFNLTGRQVVELVESGKPLRANAKQAFFMLIAFLYWQIAY